MAPQRNGNGKNGRHPQAGGRHKIDWRAAKRAFMRDPTLSYGDIARTFGVSDTSVRNHAAAENWEEAREDFLAELDARERAKDLASLEQRRARTIEVAEKLRDRILGVDLDALDLTAAIRSIPRYAQLEELFAGEATDRISIGEVNEFRQAVLEAVSSVIERVAAGELAPAEARKALAEELQRRATEARESSEAPA